MITLASDGTLSLDLSQETSVQDNILLSLSTPLGAFFQRPDFGSELPSLQRGKAIAGKVEPAAIGMVRRALQWMLDLSLIDSVDAQATLASPTQLYLSVDAHSGSETIHVDYWIPVPNKAVS